MYSGVIHTTLFPADWLTANISIVVLLPVSVSVRSWRQRYTSLGNVACNLNHRDLVNWHALYGLVVIYNMESNLYILGWGEQGFCNCCCQVNYEMANIHVVFWSLYCMSFDRSCDTLGGVPCYDDIMIWKRFLRWCPFVMKYPVDCTYKCYMLLGDIRKASRQEKDLAINGATRSPPKSSWIITSHRQLRETFRQA